MTEENITRFNILVNNLGELKQVRYKGIHFENPYLQVNKDKAFHLPYDELKEKLLALRKKLEMKELAGLINKQKVLEIRDKIAQESSIKTENDQLRRNVSAPKYVKSKRDIKLNSDTFQSSLNAYSLTDRYIKDVVPTRRGNKQLSIELARGLNSTTHQSRTATSPGYSREILLTKDSGSKSSKSLLKSTGRQSGSTSGQKNSNRFLSSESKSEISRHIL